MDEAPDMGVMGPFVVESVELLRSAGLIEWQFRYDEEQEPIVYVTVARLRQRGEDATMVGCGLAPARAVYDVLEAVIDGATCGLCSRPMSMVEPGDVPLEMAEAVICHVTWAASVLRWIRACEQAGN